MAGVFILASRTRAGAAIPLAAAALVAWSRIYVGVHFPADAAMGAFLGLSAAGLVTAAIAGRAEAIDSWGRRHGTPVQRATGVLYVVIGFWLLVPYEALPGQARIPLAVGVLALFPALLGVYSRISRR